MWIFQKEVSAFREWRGRYTQPFPVLENRAKHQLELIHTDVCGPIEKKSIGGASYFVTFIDDMTRRVFVYDKFLAFKNMSKNQLGRKIWAVRSDNGREFVNKRFDNLLEENGIERQLTVPYSPHQNGLAERANRALVDMARSLLVHSGMPESLWAEAVMTACYIRNRPPTAAVVRKTPYEAWSGKKPNVGHMRIFGSFTMGLEKGHRGKFKAKAAEASSRNAENVLKVEWQREEEEQTEDDKSEESSESLSAERSERYMDRNQQDEEAVSPAGEAIRIGPGRPRMIRTGKSGRPRQKFNVVNAMIKAEIPLPQSCEEALHSKQATFWKEAMKSEYDTLVANNTWTIRDLPKGEN